MAYKTQQQAKKIAEETCKEFSFGEWIPIANKGVNGWIAEVRYKCFYLTISEENHSIAYFLEVKPEGTNHVVYKVMGYDAETVIKSSAPKALKILDGYSRTIEFLKSIL